MTGWLTATKRVTQTDDKQQVASHFSTLRTELAAKETM